MAADVAAMSSSSCTGSPVWIVEATTSVGARFSLAADSGPAAVFSRSSESGPTTRKRQGLVSSWLGAQRASSSRSSSSSRGTGSGPYTLCVRRLRIASSRSTPLNLGGDGVGAFDQRLGHGGGSRFVARGRFVEQAIGQPGGQRHDRDLRVDAQRAGDDRAV